MKIKIKGDKYVYNLIKAHKFPLIKIKDPNKKKEFWKDILYLGMKVGEKGEFAPHVKIGEKSS